MPLSDTGGPSLNRRGFVALIAAWGALLAVLAGTTFAMLRSLLPNVLFEPDRRFKLGRPADFNEPSVTFLEESRLFVIRQEHAIRAVSGVCTHLGCTVNEDTPGGGFRCPCHGSVFDELGTPSEGPAPTPLPNYALNLAPDGQIVVDMDRRVSPDTRLNVGEA